MGLDNFVNVIESDSSEAASKFEDESVDFIFIDADHRYSSIKKDLTSWYPKVKEDGIFCGHDFEYFGWDEKYIEKDSTDGRHHGVIKAVQETFKRVNWLPSTIWWSNKKNELLTPFMAPKMSVIDSFNYIQQ